MPVTHFFPHLFFFLVLAMSGILFGLAVFAFSSPKKFIEFMTPLYWITRTFFKTDRDRVDQVLSYSMGMAFFLGLLTLQFLLGGFFVTGIFKLWNSPFALFFYNY